MDEEPDTDGKHKTIYTYMDSGDNRYSLVKRIMAGGKATFYEYDENGISYRFLRGQPGQKGRRAPLNTIRETSLSGRTITF